MVTLQVYRLSGVVLMLLLLVAAILVPAPAAAQTLNLGNTAVARDGDVLTARFSVKLAGVEEIASILRNGIPLRFTGKASLFRTRRFWVDKFLGSGEFRAVLSYDSLKKEFVVRPPGEGSELQGADLEPMLETLWGEIILPLGKWDVLQRGVAYSLCIDVSLDRTEVPDWVSRALFFWDWEEGPSTSYQLDFRF